MADRPGRGQLRAWQGPGRGQGPRSGRGRGQILAVLGPRGQNLRSEVRFLVPGSDFGHFGPFWVGQGSERGRDDGGVARQRAAEGLAEAGESQGPRSGEGSGVRFWPFWAPGVKI